MSAIYCICQKHYAVTLLESLKCPSSALFTLQRTHRLPKEMAPVEPSAFAAQLIARLEKLKREQDTMSSLEERLQQIQEVQILLNPISIAFYAH